jgi:hypothetical protein
MLAVWWRVEACGGVWWRVVASRQGVGAAVRDEEAVASSSSTAWDAVAREGTRFARIRPAHVRVCGKTGGSRARREQRALLRIGALPPPPS